MSTTRLPNSVMGSVGTIGADPEFFIIDKATKKIISAAGLIGGTKYKPKPLLALGKGFYIQEDNVTGEFNIPPVENPEIFSQYIHNTVRFIEEALLQKLNLGISHKTETRFLSSKLTKRQELFLGCAPDFDAYNNGEPFPQITPETLIDKNNSKFQWRFAGGHVHLGIKKTNIPPYVLAHFADLFLGLPLVRVDRQKNRRQLLGLPGRFRPTSYGIEYRTLSNSWIWDKTTALHVGYCAYSMLKFISLSKERTLKHIFSEVPWYEVQQTIKNQDFALAIDLRSYLNMELGVGLHAIK